MQKDMYIVNKPFWKSKKFGAMVVGITVPLLNHFFGWSIDQTLVLGFYFTVVTYITGQSIVDAKH